jgi:maleate isomerase
VRQMLDHLGLAPIVPNAGALLGETARHFTEC